MTSTLSWNQTLHQTRGASLALLCPRCHHDLHHGHYHITITNGTPHIHTINRAPPARTR